MQDDWATMLDMAEFQYNNNVHSSTGMTPFFANYGFHRRISPSPIEKTIVPVTESISARLSDINHELKAMIQISTQNHARSTTGTEQRPPNFHQETKFGYHP